MAAFCSLLSVALHAINIALKTVANSEMRAIMSQFEDDFH